MGITETLEENLESKSTFDHQHVNPKSDLNQSAYMKIEEGEVSTETLIEYAQRYKQLHNDGLGSGCSARHYYLFLKKHSEAGKISSVDSFIDNIIKDAAYKLIEEAAGIYVISREEND